MSTILFADDNPHAQRMGSQILAQEGYSVITVSNGDEAMEHLLENRVDLVMVDTRMPGPSGFDICRHVKTSANHAGVKVVLLAGPLEPFDAAKADEVGSDGVLHKPLDAYSLIDTVKSLLGATLESGETESVAEGPASAAPKLSESARDPLAQPRKPASARPGNGEVPDELTALVEKTMGDSMNLSAKRLRVRQAVEQVLQAAMPAMADRITEQVIASLRDE